MKWSEYNYKYFVCESDYFHPERLTYPAHSCCRGQNPVLDAFRNCNNNSSPLHAVGIAAISQLALQEPSPRARQESPRGRQESPRTPVAPSPLRPAAPTEFPGVLPTDVVVELPSPTRDRRDEER